ncbi:unnamed protein product [Rhizoctonia solani]|uniref:Uncharacterized protein n=1 Tax=Rhizoctonia solani TaxID=456999 RepID=A0A8H3GLX4_9AGAM|nr:unnamed protein product [Rhizoctonia solani]
MLTRIRTIFRRIFGRFGILDNLYYRVSDPIRRVSSAHRPFKVAFNLILPLNHTHYPLVPASYPKPLEVLERPELAQECLHRDGHYHQLRSVALFSLRDTPIRSLYRLCVGVSAQDHNEIMLEAQYFWHHKDWSIRNVPDPRDSDPVRYAMLASIVEELVDAFNFKLELGLRRGIAVYDREVVNEEVPLEVRPEWVSYVGRLDDLVNFCGESDQGSISFQQRNIIADVSQFRNI